MKKKKENRQKLLGEFLRTSKHIGTFDYLRTIGAIVMSGPAIVCMCNSGNSYGRSSQGEESDSLEGIPRKEPK